MRLQPVSVLLLIATLSQPVFARNISNEQSEAATARDAVAAKSAGESPLSIVVISLAPGQFEDAVGDDAELDFRRAGIDRLGASLEVDGFKTPPRHLDRGVLRQRCL